jgi:hypothetical protein
MIHLLLPITLYRPEEMRVIEVFRGESDQQLFLVQAYRPKTHGWVSVAEHLALGAAISDALDWYSFSNVFALDKVREAYANASIQIVDNLDITP